MIKYEDLYNEVKNILSEKRFIHTEGVIERAIEYGEIYGEDKETVKLVALSHDIAKEIPKEERVNYAKDIGVELDEIEKTNLELIHSKVGAKICKDKYGFSDEMVNAVKYHTTGRSNMSMLEKIIYLADATEKNRNYCSQEFVVEMAKKNIDEAMFFILKWTIGNLLEQNKKIHIDTIIAYNYYNKK